MVSRRMGAPRFLFRSLLTLAALLLVQQARGDSEYAAAWGPDVGTQAPLLAALDQNSQPQNLETLRGDNGLLFVFNRSVDW
ncbi:MAG: hypothetical protein AAF515_07490 [Pseudomonadota bacterium]